MDLCLEAKRRPGLRVTMRWYKYEGLNLEGMPMADRGVEREEGEEDTDGTETATDDSLSGEDNVVNITSVT